MKRDEQAQQPKLQFS